MSAPPDKTPSNPPVRIDWEAVETAYRIGIDSLRTIADTHGGTEGAIRKRAKKQNWSRDLTAKVQARTDELVRKAEVRSLVRKTTTDTEREQIEISAQVRTAVILAHRESIPKARSLTMGMFVELELQSNGRELLAQLGEIMRTDNEAGVDRKNDLYNKVLSLSGRSDTLKKLADSMKVLISLEREAFGLNVEEIDTRDALTQILHGIATANYSGFKPVAIDPEHDQ